jgi:hypothetical protein
MRLLAETRAQLLTRPDEDPKVRKEWARDYLRIGKNLYNLREKEIV